MELQFPVVLLAFLALLCGMVADAECDAGGDVGLASRVFAAMSLDSFPSPLSQSWANKPLSNWSAVIRLGDGTKRLWTPFRMCSATALLDDITEVAELPLINVVPEGMIEIEVAQVSATALKQLSAVPCGVSPCTLNFRGIYDAILGSIDSRLDLDLSSIFSGQSNATHDSACNRTLFCHLDVSFNANTIGNIKLTAHRNAVPQFLPSGLDLRFSSSTRLLVPTSGDENGLLGFLRVLFLDGTPVANLDLLHRFGLTSQLLAVTFTSMAASDPPSIAAFAGVKSLLGNCSHLQVVNGSRNAMFLSGDVDELLRTIKVDRLPTLRVLSLASNALSGQLRGLLVPVASSTAFATLQASSPTLRNVYAVPTGLMLDLSNNEGISGTLGIVLMPTSAEARRGGIGAMSVVMGGNSVGELRIVPVSSATERWAPIGPDWVIPHLTICSLRNNLVTMVLQSPPNSEGAWLPSWFRCTETADLRNASLLSYAGLEINSHMMMDGCAGVTVNTTHLDLSSNTLSGALTVGDISGTAPLKLTSVVNVTATQLAPLVMHSCISGQNIIFDMGSMLNCSGVSLCCNSGAQLCTNLTTCSNQRPPTPLSGESLAAAISKWVALGLIVVLVFTVVGGFATAGFNRARLRSQRHALDGFLLHDGDTRVRSEKRKPRGEGRCTDSNADGKSDEVEMDKTESAVAFDVLRTAPLGRLSADEELAMMHLRDRAECKRLFENFEVLADRAGKGSFGVVSKLRLRPLADPENPSSPANFRALKKMVFKADNSSDGTTSSNDSQSTQWNEVLREALVLNSLSHENIVRVDEAFASFQDESQQQSLRRSFASSIGFSFGSSSALLQGTSGMIGAAGAPLSAGDHPAPPVANCNDVAPTLPLSSSSSSQNASSPHVPPANPSLSTAPREVRIAREVFIVMEWVDGGSLEHFVCEHRGGTISALTVSTIMLQLCRGVDYLHDGQRNKSQRHAESTNLENGGTHATSRRFAPTESAFFAFSSRRMRRNTLLGVSQQPIVHADLSPRNVLLDLSSPERQRVVIADFGTAKCAGARRSAFTESFAAPELASSLRQSHGHVAVEPAHDIFSCGAIAFYLMNHGDMPPEQLWKVVAAHMLDRRYKGGPRFRQYPLALVDFVFTRMLNADPRRRPTAHECVDFFASMRRDLLVRADSISAAEASASELAAVPSSDVMRPERIEPESFEFESSTALPDGQHEEPRHEGSS